MLDMPRTIYIKRKGSNATNANRETLEKETLVNVISPFK